MKKLLGIIALSLFLSGNVYAAGYECVYKFKDKSGILRTGGFPWSYVEINTFLKKMTFFPFKATHMKRNEGVKFKSISFSKENNGYRSDKFKQRKLTEKEKKYFKNEKEYMWDEVKDEYLNIWFSNIKRNPFTLKVYTSNSQNFKWILMYDCYKPRK